MASELVAVPSLRALAFNRIAERYIHFEHKGREDQLVLLLSKMPITLIPELMRRKAAYEAVEAADDAKEVVARAIETCASRTRLYHSDIQCRICDHEQGVTMEATNNWREKCSKQVSQKEIEQTQENKRRKLLAHHIEKPVCPNYGFAEDE